MSPWNFRLADIAMPVHIWYGEQDLPVYREAAEFAAETIPDARLTDSPMQDTRVWRSTGVRFSKPCSARLAEPSCARKECRWLT